MKKFKVYLKELTIVGRCRICASQELPDGVYPPNITARSSSVTVRENLSQGGGLDPFTEGEDHKPRIPVLLIIVYVFIN